MSILKNVFGIDISKDTFDVQFARLHDQQQQEFIEHAQFKNNSNGFRQLMKWSKRVAGSDNTPTWFVMEATGVYHEHLAYYLSQHDQSVAVVLPTKMKNYVKSLDRKSKTDRLDAHAIAQFGLERPLERWQPPTPQLLMLKALVREYDTITEHITAIKNQLHAKEHSHAPLQQTLDRLHEQLHLFEEQCDTIQKEIRALIDQDSDLGPRITNITTAQGVGFMTAVRVIAETSGFALITSAKQLTSYAGLDVMIKQSGLRSGKPSISRKGNSRLRRAVFMPALAAVRFNPVLRNFYQRLLKLKNNKKVALIAVARKLLCLIYALWRDNVPFNTQHNVGSQYAV